MSRNKNDSSKFKERIRAERYRMDESGSPIYDSTEAFAKKLGVSRQTVGFWLKGERSPDMDMLIKISKALNMSIDYLVGISDSNSMDADIQAVARFTGLSENAVSFIKEDIIADSLVKFINSFVEDNSFQKFIDAFIKTMSLAGYISRYNVDASHTERVPLSYDDHIYYSLEFNMNDLMHNECDHIGKYVAEFSHLYFDHLINLPHGDSMDEFFDDSGVK